MREEVIEGEALAVREEPTAVVEWTPSFVRSVDDQLAMLRERDRFYREVLKEGVHYGVIPGTQKPSLWKPGAEALCSGMALHAETGNEEPPVVDVTGGEHNGEPFVQYVRFCRIYRQTGPTKNDRVEVAKLVGACNSWEPKYRYRNASRVCPQCGKEAIIKGKDEYGGGWVCFKKKDGCGAKFNDGDPKIESQESGKVANENVLELQNTILKMADKRALIAATLVATGCSDIFTQDVEDMPRTMGSQERNVTPRQQPAKAAPQDDDTPANRERGIKAVHAFAREHKIDLDAPDSPYRRILLEDAAFAHHFMDPAVEVSSKALTYPELRRFYAALKAHLRQEGAV